MDTIIEWTETYRVLEEYAIRLRNLYQDKLIKGDKIATGDLMNNVEYIIEKDSRSVSVSLQLEDYWKYVEDGRPAGKYPPIDKILDWIRVKPIVPDERSGRLPTENQLAFLIARAIAGKSPNQENLRNPEGGIEGTHYLQESQEEVLVEFEDKLSEAVGRDVDRYMDILMTEYFR